MYQPPRAAEEAGVVRRKTFEDGRPAAAYAREQNRLLDLWRKGKLSGELGEFSTFRQVAASYLQSKRFHSLREVTQRNYKYNIDKIINTPVSGRKLLGDFRMRSIKSMDCSRVYDQWVNISTSRAEYLVRVFSIIFSYAMSLDLADFNPMSKIQKVSHTPEDTPIWTKEQVESFVDTAMTNFRWRNIGLIALMAYEWCQRPKDIRLLKWSDVDFDEGSVTITQTKRGATVRLPLDEPLYGMLKQQHEDFDFQEWVVPNLRPADGVYVAYRGRDMRLFVQEILKAAGLPDYLNLGYLRKTGIVEMNEAGVDAVGMMNVTGHKDIGSLTPYLKRTLKGATTALNKRKQIHD